MWLQNETFSVQWKNKIEIFNIWNYFEKSKFVLISTYLVFLFMIIDRVLGTNDL